MSSEARREKWRTIVGFSLVLAVNPLLPLPILCLHIFEYVLSGGDNGNDHAICFTRAQINTIGIAVAQYKTLNRSLPASEQGLRALVEPPQEAKIKRKLAEIAAILDPWGRPFQYRRNEIQTGREFEIWSLGEDGLDNTADDITLE